MYSSRIERALKQPIYLLKADYEEEDQWYFTVQGFSGSMYNITITPDETSCTCPDFTQRRKICKHIYYIVGRVAQDKEALKNINEHTTNIFEIKEDLTEALKIRLNKRLEKPTIVKEKQKKKLDDDCSICFEGMTSGNTTLCVNGHNFHKSCMVRWLKVKHNCPLCRGGIVGEGKSVTEKEVDELAYFSNFLQI